MVIKGVNILIRERFRRIFNFRGFRFRSNVLRGSNEYFVDLLEFVKNFSIEYT